MKAGRSLQDLAREIESQMAQKRDFVAPAKALEMALDGETPVLSIKGDAYAIRPLAHKQLAEHLNVPYGYYDRMLTEEPDLLVKNVNTWLAKSTDRRLLRTFGQEYGVRAYLSDRYRPLDNMDVAEAVLPTILQHQWEIRSCELTETKLYLKIVSQDIQAEITPGHINVRDGGTTHIVHPGLVVSNSEVGLGSLSIQPSLHWQYCLNLATLNASVRRAHVGKRLGSDEVNVEEFLSDRTRALENRALFAKVKDLIEATVEEKLFRRMIAQVAASTEDRILATAEVGEVVEVVGKHYGLTERSRKGILGHLIEGGDLSRYGLSAAITRASQDETDYEDASLLERVGGQLLELTKGEWKALEPVS